MRSYRQFCGVARALDVVGERWTLLLVRNLLLGPRRYGELLAETPGITTNLLAARLRHLERAEIVAHEDGAYRLTDLGRALDPVVNELGRFGQRTLTTPHKSDRVDLMWALLSSRRRYTSGPLGTNVVELVTREKRERRFSLWDDDGKLQVRDHGPLPLGRAVVARVSGPPPAFFAWLRGARSPAELAGAGDVQVDGDGDAWLALGRAIAPIARPLTRTPSGPTSKR